MPMNGPTWRAPVVTRTATRSPSPKMSSIVKKASERPFETRSIVAFMSARPSPVDEDLVEDPAHELLVPFGGHGRGLLGGSHRSIMDPRWPQGRLQTGEGRY